MDFGWILFGLQGRINRAKYWLSLAIYLIGIAVFIMLFLGDIQKFVVLKDRLDNSIKLSVFIPFFAIGVPMIIAGAWIFTAATIKRLHDRGKSGWWMLSFYVAPAFLEVAAERTSNMNWMSAAALTALVLTIWGFIETCCLKGIPGTNRFGPDPLSPQKRIGRLMAHR